MLVDEFNATALAKRAALPPLNDFASAELDNFPPYYGWVKCNSGAGEFAMFSGGDDFVAVRLFWNGSYEKTTLQAWSMLARSADVALDIGTHTGVYTLAAKAANPQVTIAAFEPVATNHARLTLNMRANGMPIGKAYMLAVGEKQELIQFYTKPNSFRLTTGGSLRAAPNAVATQVEKVALDAFFPAAAHGRIGLVKIDVEGFEPQVLEGMRNIVTTAKPVIFFECIQRPSGEAVQRFLEPLGYAFFEVDDARRATISRVAAVTPHFDDQGRPILSRVNRIAAVGTDWAKSLNH